MDRSPRIPEQMNWQSDGSQPEGEEGPTSHSRTLAFS